MVAMCQLRKSVEQQPQGPNLTVGERIKPVCAQHPAPPLFEQPAPCTPRASRHRLEKKAASPGAWSCPSAGSALVVGKCLETSCIRISRVVLTQPHTLPGSRLRESAAASPVLCTPHPRGGVDGMGTRCGGSSAWAGRSAGQALSGSCPQMPCITGAPPMLCGSNAATALRARPASPSPGKFVLL